jgi:Ca2+/Na+ antiporter
MNKENYNYVLWQCLLVLLFGVVGLIGVCIKPNLPHDISILFALVFIICILVALFFFIWIRHKKKQEEEDRLIDSIGETEQ